MARDFDAKEYMPQPPLVTYTRPKNLRDLIFRAQVPKNHLRGGMRMRQSGFYKCQKESIVLFANTVVMQHLTYALSLVKKPR